jgi:hypothetical protein
VISSPSLRAAEARSVLFSCLASMCKNFSVGVSPTAQGLDERQTSLIVDRKMLMLQLLSSRPTDIATGTPSS